jgi:hypothetical protein
MKVLPVGDDSTPTPTALSRVGVISHDSGGYPGDSIPFVMEYIVVESWDQFGCANVILTQLDRPPSGDPTL